MDHDFFSREKESSVENCKREREREKERERKRERDDLFRDGFQFLLFS
jgi:hypothetical protein